MDDRFELMRQLNKKMNKYVTREKEEVLNIKTNILHNSKSQANISKPGTYRVDKKIFKNTIFEVGDAFDVLKELEDNSNTIFFFRNALGHLNDLYAKEFAQLASKKLKQGSIIAIGEFDTHWTFIKDHLYRNGFTEIMNNVWQKDSDLKTNLKKFAYKFKQFFKYKCI